LCALSVLFCAFGIVRLAESSRLRYSSMRDRKCIYPLYPAHAYISEICYRHPMLQMLYSAHLLCFPYIPHILHMFNVAYPAHVIHVISCTSIVQCIPSHADPSLHVCRATSCSTGSRSSRALLRFRRGSAASAGRAVRQPVWRRGALACSLALSLSLLLARSQFEDTCGLPVYVSPYVCYTSLSLSLSVCLSPLFRGECAVRIRRGENENAARAWGECRVGKIVRFVE
jgi:hypothetical protein